MKEFLAQLEINCDAEVLEEWEKSWLPRHTKRPKPKSKKLKVARCLNLTELREQGVLDGMTDEEAIEKWDDTWPYPVEKEDEEEDVDISETMEKKPDEIQEDLVRLRDRKLCFIDFTLDKKEISPALAEYLKPGQILFSLAETEHMSEWYACREYRDGKGTVALLKRTKSSEFIFIPEDPENACRFNIQLSEKTFVYRAGATVLLCSNEVDLVTIRFKTKEEALRFELDVMLVAEFDTRQLVCLFGEFPEQQLKIKDYIGSAAYKPTQEFVLHKIMEENENLPFSINISPSSLVDNVRNRIKEYYEYCKLLQIRLFKEHSRIQISEEMSEFITEVQKDLDCLLTLIPFCRPSRDSEAQSLPDMAKDMLQLLDNLECCLTLKKCSEIHKKYIPCISMLLENVREILSNELVETALDFKTAIAMNKEVFADRSISLRILFTSNGMKNVVSLAELSQRKEICSYSDANAILAGEKIGFKKQILCLAMLQDFVNFTEKSICFNHEEWLKLRSIRDKLVPNHADWKEPTEDATTVTDTVSNDSTTDSFDSYEKVDCIPCPQSWHSYRKFVADEFQHVREVGSGSYGVATLLLHKKLWRVVYKEYDFNVASHDEVKREIDMMIKLQKCKNIVRLYGFYYNVSDDFDRLPCGIVMEYIERSLAGLIHDQNGLQFKYKYTLKTALEHMKGMAGAFAAMHELGVLHRDIYPKNILVKYDGTIQVCDFGTCIDALKTRKTFMRGTIVYMSPEMINKEGQDNYDEKTDVFSLGVVMWELIHRMKLYPGKSKSQVIDFICAGERLPMNGDFCPNDLQKVISSAWADLPTDRPSMKELEVSFSRLLTQFSEADLGKELTGSPRKNKTEEYEEYDMTSE